MNSDWNRDIQELDLIRRITTGSDGKRSASPNPPATAAQIKAAETRLGFRLDPQYRGFLECSNGWDDFYISTKLFGTDDFLGKTDLFRRADECVAAFVEFNPDRTFPPDDHPLYREQGLEPPTEGISASDMLPIGFSTSTGAVTMIGRQGTACAGQVLDLYGTALNRYPDFRAFFQNAIQYERSRLE